MDRAHRRDYNPTANRLFIYLLEPACGHNNKSVAHVSISVYIHVVVMCGSLVRASRAAISKAIPSNVYFMHLHMDETSVACWA